MKRSWAQGWWAEHMHALRSVASSLAREPWAWAGNVAVLATAVLLPLGLHLALQAAAPMARLLVTDPEISIFIALDAPASAMVEVRRGMDAKIAIRRSAIPGSEFIVVAVPKADALARFNSQAQRAGQTGAVALAELKVNPLPDGFVVRARQVPAEALAALAEDLRKIERVERVQLDAEWAGTLAGALRWLALAQWVLMGLFGTVVVAVTFGAARAQVLADREEIAVARLIGATNDFVRRPFVLRGALLGLLGGGLALGVSMLAAWLFGRVLEDPTLLLPRAGIGALTLLLPCTLGAVGGWWCAHLAIES
jgi:cell division transport system permease protein